jgi:hypothetical protein
MMTKNKAFSYYSILNCLIPHLLPASIHGILAPMMIGATIPVRKGAKLIHMYQTLLSAEGF